MAKRMPVRLFFMLFALTLTSCALFGGTQGTKPFLDMTPTEKAVYFQKIYNGQYDDALAMAMNPNLTTAQLDIYRIKRLALIQVRPLIMAYKLMVDSGGTPTAEQEQRILDIINRLVTVGSGG